MADTERHVKRFVFGRLLPVRGVDHVWERRYGWHWVVEVESGHMGVRHGFPLFWEEVAWLHPNNVKRPLPKIDWDEAWPELQHGYRPKGSGMGMSPPKAE